MDRMLIYSDNHAADMLFKDVGGPRAVHHFLTQNGVHGVHVDRTIAQLLADKRDLWDSAGFEHAQGHDRAVEGASTRRSSSRPRAATTCSASWPSARPARTG